MAKADKSNDFRNRVHNAKKPTFWIPKEEGDFVTGNVLGFRAMQSRFGDGEVIELKDDETEEVLSIFLSSVIKTARERENIKAGDHIGIKYLGIVEGPNADYKDFIVMVDRPEAPMKEEAPK